MRYEVKKQFGEPTIYSEHGIRVDDVSGKDLEELEWKLVRMLEAVAGKSRKWTTLHLTSEDGKETRKVSIRGHWSVYMHQTDES